jgi:hypothetical protein
VVAGRVSAAGTAAGGTETGPRTELNKLQLRSSQINKIMPPTFYGAKKETAKAVSFS